MREYFGSSMSSLRQYETSSFTHRLNSCCLHCWLFQVCCIFLYFELRISLNEIWGYHFLFNKMRWFTFQKILGLHIHFWIYSITEYSVNAPGRFYLKKPKSQPCKLRKRKVCKLFSHNISNNFYILS